MNREQLKQQIVKNFEDAEITEKERLINVMQCIDAHIEQLNIHSVVVTLPSIESQEFEDYLTKNSFKLNTEGTRLKDNKIYFLNTIYKHYCNTLEFGN